jgi:hypothetical protein
MRWPSARSGRLILPLVLTMALGGSAYAYMASNVDPPSSAGAGAGTITGYTVGGITYDLSQVPGDPDNLVNVAFSLTPAPGGQPATSVAVWFDNNKSNVASSRLGTCTQIGQPMSGGVTFWTCSLNVWDQEAGPAPTSTVLDVAASH